MILCELPPFLKTVTCAVTGHRVLPPDFDDEILKTQLEKIEKSGYKAFLVGMALGFDTRCFSALENLRDEGADIKIYSVIPCLDQSERFNRRDKELYDKMISAADGKVILYQSYTKDCMLRRNDFMLENCSLVYSYFNGIHRGGTFYTVNKAKERGLDIIYYPL